MTENYGPARDDDSPDQEPRWRTRASALARAVIGVTTGAVTGWITRDVGLGVTTAAAAVSILREVLAEPQR